MLSKVCSGTRDFFTLFRLAFFVIALIFVGCINHPPTVSESPAALRDFFWWRDGSKIVGLVNTPKGPNPSISIFNRTGQLLASSTLPSAIYNVGLVSSPFWNAGDDTSVFLGVNRGIERLSYTNGKSVAVSYSSATPQ